MKSGPDISRVASLIGDPARANMVLALMSGNSLSAADLAREANVTPSTAAGHLGKLVAAGLLGARKQGRNRYFTLAEPDVAHAIEALIAVAGAKIWVDNRVDFSQNRNLIVAAITLVLGTGDFTLKFGGFALGGIGTATFGAIALHWLLKQRRTA